MILNDAQIKDFEAAATPLMLWLEDNCHPHCKAVVDSRRAEVIEQLVGIIKKEPISPCCSRCKGHREIYVDDPAMEGMTMAIKCPTCNT